MRRLPPFALAFLVILLGADDARALTTPLPGATLYPTTGAPLRLPFPAGARIRITSGYGPTAGSSLHRNVVVADRGNDHYALDLVYDGVANGGLGMPIVAAVGGTVVRAGWATSGWSNFGQRVILRHDLGDGSVYHSLYAHMNAIDPGITEGMMVTQGQVLGELGGSCMGALSCSSFSGPHLHFSVHRDSSVGGSGTGGSYGGNAVVPESIDGYEDLARGQVLTSMNTGAPMMCGDGFCTGDETSASCPDDCPSCASIPSVGRAVDETEICFTRGGDPSYWRTEMDGWAGSLLWTHTTDAAAADNHGIWDLTFDEGGNYLVEVYTDGDWAQARMAAYDITHVGATDTVTVDQSAADGWQSLGEHAFSSGGGQRVRLDDNTGEPFSLSRQIVFDAIRLTRTDVPPMNDAGTMPADAGSMPPGDGGTVPPGDGGGPLLDGGDRPPGVDGCGCRAVGRTNSPSFWLLVLLLLPWLRRRSSAP